MATASGKPVIIYNSNADASTYTHGTAYTPTADSCQLIFVTATACTLASPTITGGSGWSISPALVTSATFNSGASTLYLFRGVAGASPGSFTAVFDCTGDAATGCMMAFVETTGCDLTTPILQTKIKNSTTGSNPTITADASVITTSSYVFCVATNANPAGVTAPSAFAILDDTGHTSPAAGIHTSYEDHGETGTTFTGTRASINHGIIFVEIQVPIVASTPSPGGTLLMMGV